METPQIQIKYYEDLKRAMNKLWIVYGDIPACSRDEIVEIKLLKDIIDKRLDIMLNNIYEVDSWKEKRKNKGI